ncbi:retrovirus-related Pol polyprotein from transposon 412 [Trichonephila clavipes]|nr:retrovirus-related Pol polyprotein from transposon 412 [Trichonephila clavipes]
MTMLRAGCRIAVAAGEIRNSPGEYSRMFGCPCVGDVIEINNESSTAPQSLPLKHITSNQRFESLFPSPLTRVPGRFTPKRVHKPFIKHSRYSIDHPLCERGAEFQRVVQCVTKISSVEEKIALKVGKRFEAVENKVEDEIAIVEEEIEKIKGQVEERIEGVAENFSLMSQRVEDLEKKLLVSGNATNETKFVPAAPVHVPSSAVPLTASPMSIKLSTCDGKTNWEVYRTQFSIISEANGWTEGVKACQLAAFLGGEAAELLQTLPDTERLNLNFLYNALDLRFGQKYSKDYARLQMETRLQKTGESLQEYASEVERLANLAFSDHPATVREVISLQYFVDGLKDVEIQKAITAVNGEDKGLYVIGQINNISCRMVVDTGVNVSIIRKDLAQNSQVSIIWTPPCVSLQTVAGDKIQVHGKANVILRFGDINYHHTAYIADITSPCILGLDFLKNDHFKLDFENSNMHSKFEDITLFGLQTQFKSNQKIIAKTKLSLSPRSECIIPGLVAENRKFRFGLIDYPDPGSLKTGVLIASSVVDL